MAGQRINDHSFWAGKGSKGSVLPLGAKMKGVPSVEGAGKLDYYCDTVDAINMSQKAGVAKLKGDNLKKGYRH